MVFSLVRWCRQTMVSWFFLDPNASRNPAMEGLRAWAVLLVFLVHGIGSFESAAHQIQFDSYLPRFVPSITELSLSDKALLIIHRSHSGVDLFFLLSGFLICRTAGRIDSLASYRHFLGRRVLRIYPAFFVSLLLCVGLYVWVLHWQRFGFRTFLANALMLYGCPLLTITPYNYVTWSLFWEMAFYLVFPVQIALTRRAFIGKAAPDLLAAGLLLTLSCLFMAFQPRVILFYYGVLLALASKEQLRALADRFHAMIVVGLYLFIEAIYRLIPTSYNWYAPLFGIAASLLFVKVCFGQGWLTRFFSSMPMRWLGNLSYSFYLLHAACISAAWQIGLYTGWPTNPWLALATFLCVSMVLSLVSSAVLFLICERWYFVSFHKKPTAQPTTAPAQIYAPQRAA